MTIADNSSHLNRDEGQDISLPGKLEAVLYLKGKPLSISEMSELLDEKENLIEQAVFTLMAGYSQRYTAL